MAAPGSDRSLGTLGLPRPEDGEGGSWPGALYGHLPWRIGRLCARWDTGRVARRFTPLSPRQVEVLRWVAGGCADGVWPDSRYKVTVYALADRGLVTVSRRRDSWRAGITDQGRYYLDRGAYQDAQVPGPCRPGTSAAATPSSARPPLVTAQSLLAELQSDGPVTVPDPPAAVRAVYRRAINRAITEGLVPDGYGLRHTGRDRGDLVIRLARLEDAPPRPQTLPPIPVPETLEACHDAVAALRDSTGLLDVSAAARSRALLIAKAIAGECSRRGYRFGLRDDGQPSFQINAGQERFCFTVTEELERREVADPDKLAAAKYPWQRIPSVVRQVPSGRLLLRLDSGYPSFYWADRQRWTLTHKLPEMFETIGRLAAARAARRQREEDECQQRRQAWDEAIERARQAYLDQLIRKRLRDQAARSAEALAIRSYCAQLDAAAHQCEDPDRAGQIRAWALWARQEASRIDPLTSPGQLRYEIPEVSPADLEPFMPRGLTASHPPS